MWRRSGMAKASVGRGRQKLLSRIKENVFTAIHASPHESTKSWIATISSRRDLISSLWYDINRTNEPTSPLSVNFIRATMPSILNWQCSREDSSAKKRVSMKICKRTAKSLAYKPLLTAYLDVRHFAKCHQQAIQMSLPSWCASFC